MSKTTRSRKGNSAQEPTTLLLRRGRPPVAPPTVCWWCGRRPPAACCAKGRSARRNAANVRAAWRGWVRELLVPISAVELTE